MNRVLAWIAASFCFLSGVATIAFQVSVGEPPDWGITAWILTAPVLGLLLVRRSEATAMGWLLLFIGLAGAFAAIGAAFPSTPENVGWIWVIPVGTVGWFSWLALNLVGLPLLFPTGKPPGRRWRPLLWVLIATIAVSAFLALFTPELSAYCAEGSPVAADCATWEASGEALAVTACDEEEGFLECEVLLQNPIGIEWVPDPESSLLGTLTYVSILLLAVLAFVSMAIRFRSAPSAERQQIKFLFVALGFFISWTVVEAILWDGFGIAVPLPIENVMEFLSWTSIPVAIYLAITRYRLYEIDRLISRTVTYAVVVGLLTGAVALIATVVSTRFDDPLVVAATTLGVAAVFNPLRRRVQRVVDRRFNRSRYDAERVMDDFATTLRDEVDESAVVDGWRGVVTETMHPSSVGVWVRNP